MKTVMILLIIWKSSHAACTVPEIPDSENHAAVQSVKVCAIILSKNFGKDKEGVREGLHTKTCLAFDHVLLVLGKRCMAGDFKSTGTGNNASVFNLIDDCAKPVVYSILDLDDHVLVGALDKDGNRFWIAALFNKCVLLFAKRMLVDRPAIAETTCADAVKQIQGNITTSKSQSLQVSFLGTTERHDAFLGKQVERDSEALLVDKNKALPAVDAHLSLRSITC